MDGVLDYRVFSTPSKSSFSAQNYMREANFAEVLLKVDSLNQQRRENPEIRQLTLLELDEKSKISANKSSLDVQKHKFIDEAFVERIMEQKEDPAVEVPDFEGIRQKKYQQFM